MRWHDHPIQFAGARFLLSPCGGLFWPAERTLIVADLHFEKASAYAPHGSLLPPYDSAATLTTLQRSIAHYAPQRVVTLGDSFHDPRAWARLDVMLQQQLQQMAQTLDFIWVEGNHDVALPPTPLGTFLPHWVQHGIAFTHEPEPEITLPQVIGHYHPKTSLKLRPATIKGRCFVQAKDLLCLPAFGSFTGGLDITHEAFQKLLEGRAHRAYLLHGSRVQPLKPA